MQTMARWVAASVQAAGWAPLLVFLLHLVASRVLGAYLAFPPLDIPMHVLGGVAIAYFFWRSLALPEAVELLGQPSLLARYLLAFASTCSATVFWEFAEWLSDRFLGTGAQLGLEDTLFDMLLGIAGGLLFLVAAPRADTVSS